eukprot:scaffold79099_cov34-Phaeocystis_antarctica.AAC.2
MMTRSKSRIAELEARIAELEKDNDILSGKYSDLWYYGCNDDLGEVHIVEMLLRKGEKERVMDVWSDVYEEGRECGDFDEYTDEDDDEVTDKDCAARAEFDKDEDTCHFCGYNNGDSKQSDQLVCGCNVCNLPLCDHCRATDGEDDVDDSICQACYDKSKEEAKFTKCWM